MTGSMLTTLLTTGTLLLAAVQAQQFDPALVGTWTTKTKKVLTGPGFYNPVKDVFTEPELTGISYSFTADGHYEEAYYRAVSNPGQPQCPSAVLQWQHGTYTLPGNGSILFQPIAVDGRQQTSAPCSYDSSLYTRYYQPEMMEKYAVYTDPYHNVQRLDMYQFDGSPMNPMFLAYSPPLMLPTATLNPTATASATGGAGATATGSSGESSGSGKLAKRGLGGPLDHDSQDFIKEIHRRSTGGVLEPHAIDASPERIWWWGLGMVGVGTLMYLSTSR